MDEPSLDPKQPSAATAAFGVSGALAHGDGKHSLVVLEGMDPGHRIELGDKPLVIGRRTAADLVLPELQVSALHCRVKAEAGRPAVKVTDLNSTNGCFINGQRIIGSAYLAPGATLAVGRHLFRHDFLAPEALVRAACEDASRESTVAAWLPVTLTSGPVRTACCYRAGEPPRGAGLAVLPLADRSTAFILIDVAGPAEHVARRAARLLRELRDITEAPSAVALMRQLQDRWRLGVSADLLVTAWAGVHDATTQQLKHACAGHHAALLCLPDGDIARLECLNPPVGLLPGTEFTEACCAVPLGSRLHLFNKGVFDFVDPSGRPFTLDDFEALLACGQTAHEQSPDQVFVELRRLAGTSRLDDDFLLMRADLC